MLVLNDFTCLNGHKHEYFVDNNLKTTQCQECSEVATKVIGPISFQLEGVTGAFPGAAMKWAKKREKQMAYEAKYDPS